MEINATLLHGEESIPCHAAVDNGKVHIFFPDGTRNMLIWPVHRTELKLDNGSYILRDYGADGDRLLCDAKTAEQIRNSEHQTFEQPKKKWTGSHYFVVLLPLTIIGACIGIYFLVLPWLSQLAASAIPIDTEIAIGESMSRQYIDQSVNDDSINNAITSFRKALQYRTPYPVNIRIIRSTELNAFAVPGGNIFIYSGLLEKMSTPEELAALIGHELTHVNERHSLKSLCRKATGLLVISAFFGGSDISSWLIDRADDLKQLDYSRSLESDADAHGIDLMVQRGIDPRGMVNLLKILQSQEITDPGAMKYLSTHPETQERIDAAEDKISSLHADVKSTPAAVKTAFYQLKRALGSQ